MALGVIFCFLRCSSQLLASLGCSEERQREAAGNAETERQGEGRGENSEKKKEESIGIE